eukprot:g1367.t1 g1367   contig10:1937414-1939577(-)
MNNVPLLNTLGANASIPYTTIQANGPPSRPLEFPAPTVDKAMTVSAHVIDHRTGNVFRATSVLMRRPVHAKNCASRSPVNANSSSPDLGETLNDLPPCGAACDLPERAYCVRRKLCDTIYGSVRLCVVMRRVSRHVGTVKGGGGTLEGNPFEVTPTLNYRGGLNNPASRRGNGDGDNKVEVPAWETTDQMVAIKVVNWSKVQQFRGRHLEDPIKELAAMQLLGDYHSHVISLSDSLQDETHLFCIYPYIPGGDLYGRLLDEMRRSPNHRIDESQARAWFRQILAALIHLQKKGVCHRDLCMDNMMVDERDNIRIIDLGLCLRVPYADPNNRNLVTDVSANTMRRLMKAQGQGGKWEYMSPEVAMRHDVFDGFAIDLWAVGIVLFEFLVGKKPFAMPDVVDQNFQTISINGDLKELLRLKQIPVDNEAIDLLQNMLWCDPSKRLTLAEVVNHPWVQRGEGKRKKMLTSVEDAMTSKWFIENNPLDDDASADLLSHRLRLNSCSSVSRNDGGGGEDDATAETSDEESRSREGSKSVVPATPIEYSLPNRPSDENLNNNGNNLDIPSIGARVEEQEPTSTILDEDMLGRINTKKKTSHILTACLKPTKWWKAGKSAMSTVSSESEQTVATKVQGDGRMC